MEKNNLRKVTLDTVLTVGEFVKIVRKRTGNNKISNQTIHYHINNTDKLDYVSWCGMKLLVLNEKSENFNPGDFYGSK